MSNLLYKKLLLITHKVNSIKQDKTKGIPYKITSWNAVHDVVKIIVGDYVGYGIDASDKGVGKAITYAYKYLLMKLFMLEVGTDEDSEYSNPPANNTQQSTGGL